MKIISMIICGCLLLCIMNTIQATQLEPSSIQVYLIGGDTKNISINMIGEETIYLEHEILPDSEGINITYPLIINPLETEYLIMTINVALNIAPNNYTIILKYHYYEEVPDLPSDDDDSRDPPDFTPSILDDSNGETVDDDEEEPIDDDDFVSVIYYTATQEDCLKMPSFSILITLFILMASLIVILMLLYIIIRKRRRGEKNDTNK